MRYIGEEARPDLVDAGPFDWRLADILQAFDQVSRPDLGARFEIIPAAGPVAMGSDGRVETLRLAPLPSNPLAERLAQGAHDVPGLVRWVSSSRAEMVQRCRYR